MAIASSCSSLRVNPNPMVSWDSLGGGKEASEKWHLRACRTDWNFKKLEVACLERPDDVAASIQSHLGGLEGGLWS